MIGRSVRIATWNVNSIRARKERVLEWLTRWQLPEIVCLQETKVTDEAFPRREFEEAGYCVTVCGQETYNGAAILSRSEPSRVMRRLAGDPEDSEARFLSVHVAGVHILCLYVPNGQVVGSEKFAYKCTWLSRVWNFLDAQCDVGKPLALCGDLNIAPEARDIHDPEGWEDRVLFHPAMRQAFASLCDWGLIDTFRLHHAEGKLYSWWDYRQLAFLKNKGLRIDHILVTQPLAERCTDVAIDRETRKGTGASDHAPIIATFSDVSA